jgi:hypothetical protein
VATCGGTGNQWRARDSRPACAGVLRGTDQQAVCIAHSVCGVAHGTAVMTLPRCAYTTANDVAHRGRRLARMLVPGAKTIRISFI